MNLRDTRQMIARRRSTSSISPVASDRIRALAARAMEGAPALTAGEMRELAEAILEHNAFSDDEPDTSGALRRHRRPTAFTV